jgi:hypothetical protein
VVATRWGSSNRRWWSFVFLTALALGLPELMLGPAALIAGAVLTAFGVERACNAWQKGQWALALGVVALVAATLFYLLAPNWCHAGNAYRENGRWIGVMHCHKAWDFDHIH